MANNERQVKKGSKREEYAQIRVFIRKTIEDKQAQKNARIYRVFLCLFSFDTKKNEWLNIRALKITIQKMDAMEKKLNEFARKRGDLFWVLHIPRTKIHIEEKGVCGQVVLTMSVEDAELYRVCGGGWEWGEEWEDLEEPTDAEFDMVKLGLWYFQRVGKKMVFVPIKK